MRMTLKRLTAWMLTLMMIVSCVPASAVEGSVVDYSASTSAYDVMPLSDGEENITVTFVIDKSEYTNDPDSGGSHVRSTAAIEGGELTYTLKEIDTGEDYVVTGTGTVCSYSIPAGTSLSENGYSFPPLTPADAGEGSRYSYNSLLSWVTAGKMVCHVDTVFNENTTLYLQLFETGSTVYSINFVCSDDGHSYMSIGNLAMGQALSQERIDAATSAANAYNKSWCNYGIKSGQQIAKWQFKVTATGEMVDLKAGTPIAEAYVNEQYGNSIRAYAVWEDIPSTVTATFQYASSYDETTGDPVYTTVESRELNAGDALGTLPDMTALTPEGSTFIGWQYADADGNLMYATAETVINADTTYTAVFGTLVTATFKCVTYDEETDTDVEQIIETRQLNAGDALGTLPDMSAYENPLWVLAGWYNEEDAESEEIEYITAETVITENATYIAEFSYPECGYVTLIDILPDGSIRNGIEPNISLPVGMTIAEGIAANEEYDGFVLTDDTLASACIWRTADGELADLTEVVTAETDISLYTYTYQIILTLKPNTAAEAEGIMTLSLVETETNEDTGVITMTITAREGETLTEEQLTVNGTDLTQYAWTDSENGNAVDIQSLMNDGVTRSITATSDGTPAAVEYTLTLTLTLDGEKITKTITQPAGYILTAADFVVDGLDLTDFKWTDENGNELALASLIGTELAEDRALTSNGTLNTSLSSNNRTVRFYVFVNGQRELVTERTETTYLIGDRYYIPDSTLISVYRKYGYSGLSESVCYFPHAVDGEDTIWNADTVVNDGLYFSPALTSDRGTQTVDIYYLPTANLQGSGNYSDYISTNTFYTVNVEDAAGLVYTADQLPETTYWLVGTTASRTVNTAEGVEWVCEGQDSDVVDIDNSVSGEITYTIADIHAPYIIKTKGGVKVVYDLGTLPETPEDTEYGTPKINGQDTYSVGMTTAEAAVYVPLAPNPASYFFKSGKYLGEVTFTGWAVNGDTTNLVQPGTALDLSAYDGQTVTLTAQWEAKLGGTSVIWNSPMINFFVALNAVSEGTTSWIGNTAVSAFTQSVYTTNCGVTGTTTVNQNLYVRTETAGSATQYHVLGGTSGTDLSANHSEIVRELTAGYTKTGTDGNDYTFSATFPSDETVLKNVRKMVENGTTITINGRNIQPEELTTSNFTIKWYVFKFDNSDGWHIDGILMAKSSEMIVTKTFGGDDAAIAAVADDFEIVVAGASDNQSGIIHDGATLTLNSDGVVKNGNTYTWRVPVDQYFRYTVTENNYAYTEDLATYKSQYRVRHSTTEGENIGWTTYDDSTSIVVTGRGYNETDSDRLQVDFLNTYTKAGTVIIQKIDAVTGNLMPNVSFTIGGTRASGGALQMFDLGGSHYTADPSEGNTETSTITTDSSGQAYLWIGGGEYWLEEIVPDGYDDPGRISMTLEGEAANSYKVIAINNTTAANDTTDKSFVSVGGGNNLTLIVKNYSRTIDLKVTKDWVNKENKPVTIQLYRNGNPLGAAYTVTLDGSQNWTHTFKDLPMYADGGLAQYTIREEAIGEFKYSEQFASGYQYYDVDYSAMQYLDQSGAVTTDMSEVATIALEVSNDRNHGSLTISKVDGKAKPVSGAVFYLYKVPENSTTVPTVSEIGNTGTYEISGMTPYKTVTSAENGTVNFGEVEAGRYYVVEHSAPMGYAGSTLLYSVLFDGSNATMQYYDTEGGWTTTASRVVNTSVTVDIPVLKVWADAANPGKRPTYIEVTLTGTAGGVVVSTNTVRITADDGEVNMGEDGEAIPEGTWYYTFEDLPQYSGSNPIIYTLTEAAIPGYVTTIIDPNSKDDVPEFKITNTLRDNLKFTVSKQVEGNFADPNKEFSFTAAIKGSTGETISTETFKLSHGESYPITNIPYGATVEVTEVPDGYTAQYMLGTEKTDGATYTSAAITDDQQGVTFINTKNVTIETGVDLDGLPYTMLLLGAAGLGLIWLMTARRRRNEN